MRTLFILNQRPNSSSISSSLVWGLFIAFSSLNIDGAMGRCAKDRTKATPYNDLAEPSTARSAGRTKMLARSASRSMKTTARTPGKTRLTAVRSQILRMGDGLKRLAAGEVEGGCGICGGIKVVMA